MKKENPFIAQYIEENKRNLIKKKEYIADIQFVKVYIQANSVLSELQYCSKVLFEYLFKILQRSESYNQTEIDVSFKGYLVFCSRNKIKPMVKSSFYRARKELMERNVLAETEINGIYFFNLNYFFNGDRFFVVNEYIRVNDVEVSEVLPEKKEVPQKSVKPEQDDFEKILEEARKNKKKSALAI